jgi:hypothetical protein
MSFDNSSPLIVGEFVPHDSNLQDWELEWSSQYAWSRLLVEVKRAIAPSLKRAEIDPMRSSEKSEIRVGPAVKSNRRWLR